MGRISKAIDVDELKRVYYEVGNVKKVANIFHISNTRVLKLLHDNGIKVKNIGNKIELPKTVIKNIVFDYDNNGMSMSSICKKYDIKTDKLSDILMDNGIVANRWHNHVKLTNTVSKIRFIKEMVGIFENIGIKYELKYKITSDCVVDLLVNNNLCIDLYKNKTLVDYDGYKYRSMLNNKRKICLINGFDYIQIFEDEFNDRHDIVVRKILHILGVEKFDGVIHGRKCNIKEISKEDARIFLNKNHIQGFVGSSVYLGSFFNDELVGVMSFINDGDNKWNLVRFATLNGYLCHGLGGKLFNHFLKNYKPNEVRSFADRRWTLTNTNNVYVKLGFEFIETIAPGYTYSNGISYKRIRREQFKKNTLIKRHGFDKSMTETEMARSIGYGRIWDCGLFKYVWRNKNINDE